MCAHFGDLTRVVFCLLYSHIDCGAVLFSFGSILVTEWPRVTLVLCNIFVSNRTVPRPSCEYQPKYWQHQSLADSVRLSGATLLFPDLYREIEGKYKCLHMYNSSGA